MLGGKKMVGRIKVRLFGLTMLVGVSLSLTMLFTNGNAYAGYATGDDDGTYDGGIVNYDCTGSRGWDRCPQWVKVSKSVYQTILNNGRLDGSYSGLNQCKNDGYTVIAGYIKHSVGQLYIRNLTRDISPSKTSHILVGTANSSTSISVDVNWNGGWHGFFNQTAGTYGGESITYRRLMELIMQQNGVSEKNLAAFCMSMLKPLDAFEGKAEVNTSTTNWKKADTTVIQNITNCPYTGCRATFKLSLRRTTGSSGTPYKVSRASNYKTVSNNSNLKAGIEKFASSSVDEWTETLTLVPGQVVCEKIDFSKDGSNNVYVRACASALGDAQPSDPSDTPEDPDSSPTRGNSAFINMKVRNRDVVAYEKFQHEVYAKPGDNVTYRAVYNPILQYTYDLYPQKMRINGGTIYPTDGTNTTKTLATMFNEHKGRLKNWNNGFSVFSTDISPAVSANYKYDGGDTTLRIASNSRQILNSDVGKILKETAETSHNDTTKTTPSQVSFNSNSNLNLGNVKTTAKRSEARVVVPYNFENGVEFANTGSSDNEIVYAGESKTLNINILINAIENITVGGVYTTRVDGAWWKLEYKYGDDDYRRIDGTNEGATERWNSSSINSTTVNKRSSVQIEDVPAGTEVCFRATIFPVNSGDSRNIVISKFSGEATAEKCYKVAKKPSLQVWGGNIYTNGGISASTINKNGRTFGSWGELAVFANGTITGFASGASLGYPEGSDGSAFCNLSVLSFANVDCKYNKAGLFTSSAAIDKAKNGKLEIISRMVNDENITKVENLNMVGDLNQDSGIVFINKENEDFVIDRDMVYSGIYNDLKEVPKLVIYAKNIDIKCEVERIDALLIAENEVKTCDSAEINSRRNSIQLQINGAIIANSIDANRTYGAATGANSIIPAEIINFDPTLYLWGSETKNKNPNTSLITVYMQEMSPRY